MKQLAPYRKAAVAVGFGVAATAAYVVANPTDLPGWVVGAALGVNAMAVFAVRNRPADQPQTTVWSDAVALPTTSASGGPTVYKRPPKPEGPDPTP